MNTEETVVEIHKLPQKYATLSDANLFRVYTILACTEMQNLSFRAALISPLKRTQNTFRFKTNAHHTFSIDM